MKSTTLFFISNLHRSITGRLLLVPLFLLFAFSCLFAAPSDEKHYLMTYFVDNGQDGLHLLHSTDGLKWTPLKEGKSFLTPVVGKHKLMRDPSIVRDKEGTFHMVWTISWTQPGIGYAHSKDLIHWSEQKQIPVMEDDPNVRNCWAPELFYDAKSQDYLIIWASTVPDRFPGVGSEDNYNHRQYYVSTKDFKTFSKTKLYFDPGHNVIDSFLAQDGDTYLLFYKDETLVPEAKKSIHLALGETALGPFKVQGEVGHKNWIEGPTALKIGDYWYLYYDCYRDKHYGAVRSKDLKNWEDITDKVSFPQGVRHGTTFEVDAATVRGLME